MKMITLNLPESYIKALDNLVEQKLYPSRAEAIRFAILDMLRYHGKFEVKSSCQAEYT